MLPVYLQVTRHQLMSMIKQHMDNIDVAIEVGTWRGDFADAMCRILDPNKFYAIDPYLIYDEYTDKPDMNEFSNQENLDILAEVTIQRVNMMLPSGRSSLLREKSCDAVKHFENDSLDVVYLDANHKYDEVLKDITVWYEKVKPGAILCGDDYIPGSHVEKFGVIQAVNDFCYKNNLKLAVTGRPNPTWILCKHNKNLFF